LRLPVEVTIPVVCGSPRASLAMAISNTSAERVLIDQVDIDGPFQLETELPLRIEPGESQPLQLKTTPAVIGTDKPGDERSGSLSVGSSVGSVSVALRAAVQGTTVSVDSIPGAPVTEPLEFSCSSSGRTCPTQSFHIVNTGESPVTLSAPVGENDVVGAFVPGAAELTLQPGAGVKVELRPAAGGSATAPGVDALTLAVEGSCDLAELRVETRIAPIEACQCREASPGIQAGTFAHTYECGDDSTYSVPLFNGTAEDFLIEELLTGEVQSPPDQLPLTIASGETYWFELLAPEQSYPGYPQAVTVPLEGPSGRVNVSGSLTPSGSLLSLQSAEGGQLPSPLALPCGSTTLRVYNGGDVAAQVPPPQLTGGVVSDFTAPQTIAPGASFAFHVSARSVPANTCATTGTLTFPVVENDCSGEALALNTSYQGACTCDGL
jgi:hypothetical protein